VERLTNRYFLGAHPQVGYPSKEFPSGGLVSDPAEGIPTYRIQREAPGLREPIGTRVGFLWWPTLQVRRVLDPDSEEAETVLNYYETNLENPAMLSSPWNSYPDAASEPEGLLLPQLPAFAPTPGPNRPPKGHTPEFMLAHGEDRMERQTFKPRVLAR
jgi:hypothetical protein